MKIHDVQQNTLEWLAARSGVITASEIGNIFTTDFEIRKGEMPKTYLARKIAERWRGGPISGFNTIDMDFGKILEEEAIPGYQFEYGVQIQRVGFVTTDDGTIGCSPDGLIGDDCGIEIKCPKDETHVKYLMENRVPPEYLPQIHGGMFVTGRPKWVFFSYCRRFPYLRIEVQRDEEIQKTLTEGLTGFLQRFEDQYAALTKLNGGEPNRRPAAASAVAPDASPGFDLTP